MTYSKITGTGLDSRATSVAGRGPLRRVVLASAAMAPLFGAPAWAEQAAVTSSAVNSADSASVSEIIVTAQKREEKISSVPMSITAATGDQLARAGITQVRDLVKITPGFSFADSYVGSPIYTLRGVGFSDISLGGRPTVSVYSDEAPIPFAIETRGANLDLERVEVLKGPQGTLFGQNATGGAINFVAAKPTPSFRAGADFSYGNFNAVDAGGFLSGPLTDTLAARLSVQHTSNDPWQKSYTTGARNGAGDFTNARLLLVWTPTSRLKAQLNVNGYVDRSDTQAGQLIAVTPNIAAAAGLVAGLLTYPLAPANARAADFNPGLDYARNNRFIQVNARLDYSLSDDLTLTSLASYSHYREGQLQDIDGTTLLNLHQYTAGTISSVSEEVRIAGNLADHGHFTLGVNYAADKVLEHDHDQLPQSTDAFLFSALGLPLYETFDDINNQRETTTAVFGNADYNLTDTINVYAGARFTRSDNRFEGCTADAGDGNAASDFGPFLDFLRSLSGLGPNPTIPPGGCVTANASFQPGLVTNTLNQNNVSWRAGAQWKPVEGTLLYANVSKGFKAGGFPTLGATVADQFLPATQESVLAYEAGFKIAMLDRKLQLTGAVFYYDYRDKQILGRTLDPTFGPLLKLINVPKSELTGAELQLAWAPIHGLNISAGGSYIASKIQGGFTNYNEDGVLQNFGGEAFPNTPKWQLVSDVDYSWALSERLNGFVGGGVTYQSSTYSQLGQSPLLKSKAYALVDLRAGVATRDGTWRVSLWGRNIGDTYYWTSANHDLDTTTRFTGMPATYGVALTYRYR